MKNTKKGFVVPLILVILALAGGGYYFYEKKIKLTTPPVTPKENIATNTESKNTVSNIDVQGNDQINWNTYKGGFTNLIGFSYPSKLFINEGDSDAVFISLEDRNVSEDDLNYLQFKITIVHKGSLFWDEMMLEVNELLAKQKSFDLHGELSLRTKENRQSNIKFPSKSVTVVYIKTDKNLYQIVDWRTEGNGDQAFQKILDSIKIQTVKNQSSDWKTYKNEKYGFEFKYPSNLEFSGFPKPNDDSVRLSHKISNVDYEGGCDIGGNAKKTSDSIEDFSIRFLIPLELDEILLTDDYSKGILRGRSVVDNKSFGPCIITTYHFPIFQNKTLVVDVVANKKENKISNPGLTNASAIVIFDQILSTFKFTNILNTEGQVFDKVKIALLAGPAKDEDLKRLKGCDLVGLVDRDIPPTTSPLTASMKELFTKKEVWPYTETISGNFISSQKNLFFDRATVVDGTANIYLTGYSSLGGVCDDPRIETQINETAKQFSSVKSVKIFLNDKEFNILSQKGI